MCACPRTVCVTADLVNVVHQIRQIIQGIVPAVDIDCRSQIAAYRRLGRLPNLRCLRRTRPLAVPSVRSIPAEYQNTRLADWSVGLLVPISPAE